MIHLLNRIKNSYSDLRMEAYKFVRDLKKKEVIANLIISDDAEVRWYHDSDDNENKSGTASYVTVISFMDKNGIELNENEYIPFHTFKNDKTIYRKGLMKPDNYIPTTEEYKNIEFINNKDMQTGINFIKGNFEFS